MLKLPFPGCNLQLERGGCLGVFFFFKKKKTFLTRNSLRTTVSSLFYITTLNLYQNICITPVVEKELFGILGCQWPAGRCGSKVLKVACSA